MRPRAPRSSAELPSISVPCAGARSSGRRWPRSPWSRSPSRAWSSPRDGRAADDRLEAHLPGPSLAGRAGLPRREQRCRGQQDRTQESYADAPRRPDGNGNRLGTNRYLEYTHEQRASGRPLRLEPGVQLPPGERGRRPVRKRVLLVRRCAPAARSSGRTEATPAQPAAARGRRRRRSRPRSPEVTSTDQVNGLVVRVYPWETGTKTKTVDVDTATVSGSTPYAASPPTRSSPSTTRAVRRRRLPGRSRPSTQRRPTPAASNWPSGRLGGDEVPQADVRASSSRPAPSSPAATLTNVWRASAAVTNGGTLCYYLETFNGATSLGTHGSSRLAPGLHEQRHDLHDRHGLPARR